MINEQAGYILDCLVKTFHGPIQRKVSCYHSESVKVNATFGYHPKSENFLPYSSTSSDLALGTICNRYKYNIL